MKATVLLAQVIDTPPEKSSSVILAVIAAIAAAAVLFYFLGVIDRIIGWVGTVLRWAVDIGFASWRRWLAWASWPVFLILVVSLLWTGWFLVDAWPGVAIALGVVPILMGMAACLAYVYLDLEQYEVERGHKAVHNPLKGQEPAHDLARFGPRVGILFLTASAVAMIGGFALVNQGLYGSVGHSWYQVGEFPVGEGQATYADFLVYSLLSLYRIVDLLDLANQHRLVRLAHLQPVYWPASALLIGFKTFFTFVLLEQIFAAVRKWRLLTETTADYFSPHQSIHERARYALPYYGVRALGSLFPALRTEITLTKDQREALPLIVADIGPAAIPALRVHLRDPNEQVRAVAAAALGHLHAVEALTDLTKLQNDPSEMVRLSLVEALGVLIRPGLGTVRKKHWLLLAMQGPPQKLRMFWRRKATLQQTDDPAGLVITQLRQALADRSPVVRKDAAKALGGLGAAAAVAAPDFLVLLNDTEETVRCQAVEALPAMGAAPETTVPALIPLLQDSSPAVKAAAAHALGAFGERAASAIGALVPLLQDRAEAVREKAAQALGKVGFLPRAATDHLAHGLASPDTLVRARAAEAIGNIGAAAEGAAPALVLALKDPNDRVRAKAVEALGKIGQDAATVALPQLMRALRDQDTWVQALAAEALGEMGPAADEAIPALIRSLRHPNAQVRYYAVEALGKLGTAAAAALPALIEACRDADAGVRALAIRALGPFAQGPPAQTGLRQALQDADPQCRLAAVNACGAAEFLEETTRQQLDFLLDDPIDAVKIQAARVIAKAQGAQFELLTRLTRLVTEDDNVWVQEQAAAILGSLGPSAALAGPGLVQAVLTQETNVREAALKALAQIQPPEAALAFIAGLKDDSPDLRKMASAGWRKAAAIPEEALAGLVEALHDPEIQVRANAAFALGRLDALPREAITLLMDCTKDPNDELRLNAVLALQKNTTREVQEVMGKLVRDPAPRIRLLAAGALLSADAAHEEAQNVVHEALAHESSALRKSALALIQALGAGGAAWLSHLRDRQVVEEDHDMRTVLDGLVAKLENLPNIATPLPAGKRLGIEATG